VGAGEISGLAAADEAGSVVGQRQQNAPVTSPRGGVRQIGGNLWPGCSVRAVGQQSANMSTFGLSTRPPSE